MDETVSTREYAMTERLDPYEIYAEDELDVDLLGLTWSELSAPERRDRT